MNFEEMQAVLTQMLAAERQLQERQIEHSHNLLEIEEKQNKTQEQLDRLVTIISRFVEATNTRLDNLEDK